MPRSNVLSLDLGGLAVSPRTAAEMASAQRVRDAKAKLTYTKAAQWCARNDDDSDRTLTDEMGEVPWVAASLLSEVYGIPIERVMFDIRRHRRAYLRQL